MKAHRVHIEIPANRMVAVSIPNEMPVGPAELIVLSECSTAEEPVALAGVLGAALPAMEGDPIADALAELRRERLSRTDRSVVDG